jgi:WD40 repeat protein
MLRPTEDRVRSWPLVAALALVVGVFASAAIAGPAGDWANAVNAESIAGTDATFNTPFTDGCPIQAPDGLSFFMASNRPDGVGGLDIWVARRASTDDPWGAPANLGSPVNSTADDFCPTPLRGKGLLFVSARAGGCGGPDIYLTRQNPSQGWAEPANLGCQVNSAAGEAGPSLVQTDGDAALYFSSARPGGITPESGASGDSDIYRSPQLADGSFGTAVLVASLSTAAEDARPNVRKDGLEIVFDSTRLGGLGNADIYAAARTSTSDAWSAPVNLGPAVNTVANESRASFSWGGLQLVFGSNRGGSELAPDGVTPSNDVYVTTRER